VPTEHHHDAAGAAGRIDERAHHGAEVTRHQNVREGAEERAEGAIVAGWLGEIARADLVRTDGDRNRADRREIRLGWSGRRF